MSKIIQPPTIDLKAQESIEEHKHTHSHPIAGFLIVVAFLWLSLITVTIITIHDTSNVFSKNEIKEENQEIKEENQEIKLKTRIISVQFQVNELREQIEELREQIEKIKKPFESKDFIKNIIKEINSYQILNSGKKEKEDENGSN